MVKYLLGVASGIVVAFLFVLLVLLLLFAMRSVEPGVVDDSVLFLKLHGAIPEQTVPSLTIESLRAGPSPTLLGVRNALRRAAEDDRIRALVLHCGGLGVGWAKAQEIRWGIENFKESGKPVFAFLRTARTIDYYVASAADDVFMAPEGLLDMKGLRIEAGFYADMLAKLGVEAEVERVGKYKSAPEAFLRTGMSEESREVLNSILDDVYSRFVASVASAREKSEEEFRSTLDNGPFVPARALEFGLVDALKYEDEFDDHIKEKLELDELRKVRFSQYPSEDGSDSLGFSGANEIAVVYAVGDMMTGRSRSDPLFGIRVLGSDTFSQTVRQVKENDDVKAVILRIDSSGGSAIASDQMWRALNLLALEKPLVVSMSDVAASGGYYVAMADAPVLAYPGTYTGSIGVFYGKLNLRKLYDKIGVKKEILTRGRFAAIDTDYRSLTEEERAKLRSEIEEFYKGFVEKVAESRERPFEEIHELAQGRVWMGSQAQANGLVDELGGFDRAVELAREAAGLGKDDKIRLAPYPPPKRMIELLLETDSWGVQSSPWVDVLRPRAETFAHWPSLLEGGFLRIAPYSISVQ
jgi:protease-4